MQHPRAVPLVQPPLIMSVASLAGGRPAATPGQLGPTPAIPTLKQLQDHHIKTKTSVGGAGNSSTSSATTTNNNNNYKPLLAVPSPRTVPPVVLKLTGDPGEQPNKRTYSVTSPQAPGASSAEGQPGKRLRVDESAANDGGPAQDRSSATSPVGLAPFNGAPSIGFVRSVLEPAADRSGLMGVADGVLALPSPGSVLAVEGPDNPGHLSVLQYPTPVPYLPVPTRPPSVPPPRPPSVPTPGPPPRPPSGPGSLSRTSSPLGSSSSRAGPSSGTSARSHPPHASPLRGKHKAIRQQAMEENREGLLDCVKHVPETFQGVLRQHILMQLHIGRTQAAAGHSIVASMHKAEMISSYQPWVILTYGDAAKTKTITLSKYARIVRTLRGEEVNSAENSKFRFWVRSKGFRLGSPESDGYVHKPADDILGSYGVDTRSGHLYICTDDMGMPTHAVDAPPLYVPTGTAKEDDGRSVPVYKKVAVVENFFDIIYSVHVDIEGRGNKHAGQKRTYRTITDSYAFLPREAVTRFLLGCTECNRRPRSPTSPAAVTKDDDSADSVVGSSSGTSVASGPSQRSSPSPGLLAATSASSSPSAPAVPAALLSPTIVSNPLLNSRLHLPIPSPLPLPTEHSDFFKRFADLPRPPEAYLFESSSARTRYLTASSSPGPGPGSLPSFSPRPSTDVADVSSGRSSAFRSPGETRGETRGETVGHGQPADDPRTTSPALAEALLLPLKDDGHRGEALFKLPLPSPTTSQKDDARVYSPHSIFLHTPTGRKTDVSLTPLSPKDSAKESSVSEKLANSPFSIQNISKSSRKSPTPDSDRDSSPCPDFSSDCTILREKLVRTHDNFVVPNPPKPRSPPKAPSPSSSLSRSDDDTFLVPRPPKPRNPPPILKQPTRVQSPVNEAVTYPLRPLEAVAPRAPSAEPAATASAPINTQTPSTSLSTSLPRPTAIRPPSRPTSSIMAGFEPAAGSGLLNLLLKSGVLKNGGPRTAIPDAGEIDLNLPITTTYLKHMRSLGYSDEDALQIDVEMSLYQHVLGVPLKIVDDYL